jgi:glycyl-tRNA synthetase beta chain
MVRLLMVRLPFHLTTPLPLGTPRAATVLWATRQKFAVKDFEDYRAKLMADFVILDRATRKQKIWEGVEAQGKRHWAKIIRPWRIEKLLEEVVGLVEWPVPFVGTFDDDFLQIPPK